MSKTWKTLAEALGIETEAGPNWQKVNQKKNMQRYGTQDRRTQQDPLKYFNSAGTGAAQRQTTAAGMAPKMTPRPGGLQIPAGSDRPGQGNPLMDPPGRRQQAAAPAMQRPPEDHEMDDQDWLDMLDMSDDDEI
jgi:hypothetical protein